MTQQGKCVTPLECFGGKHKKGCPEWRFVPSFPKTHVTKYNGVTVVYTEAEDGPAVEFSVEPGILDSDEECLRQGRQIASQFLEDLRDKQIGEVLHVLARGLITMNMRASAEIHQAIPMGDTSKLKDLLERELIRSSNQSISLGQEMTPAGNPRLNKWRYDRVPRGFEDRVFRARVVARMAKVPFPTEATDVDVWNALECAKEFGNEYVEERAACLLRDEEFKPPQ